MPTKELIKRVDDRMVECNDHWIFKEYGENQKEEWSVGDAADFITGDSLDDYSWDILGEEHDITPEDVHNLNNIERLFKNNPDLEFCIACDNYRLGRGDAKQVVKTWNIVMASNGETHGTIFTGLYKNKEYELLDELMNDMIHHGDYHYFDFDT